MSGITALDAEVVVDAESLRVTARGNVRGFAVKPVTVSKVEFETQIEAPLDDLAQARYEVDARVTDPRLEEYGFDHGSVHALGDQQHARVDLDLQADDGRDLKASGVVSLSHFAVRDAKLRFQRREFSMTAEVRHFDPAGPRIDAPMIEITGPQGQLAASVILAPGVVEGKLRATDLDLSRLSSELKIASLPVTGSLNVEADVEINDTVQKARLRAGASKVSIMNWGRSDLTLTADLDGRSLLGTINGKDAIGFTTRGNWNVELGGHPLQPESWSRATGTSELGILGVDLAPLALAVPNDTLSSIDGKLGVRTLLQRTTPTGFPNAFVELGVSLERASLSLGEEPTHFESLEVYMSNAFDAANDRLNSVTTIRDVYGQLLSVSAGLQLDAEAWLENPKNAFRSFRKSDLSVSVNVPTRRLSQVPGLNTDPVDGVAEGQLALYGTLVEPMVSLQANVRELQAPGVEADAALGLSLSGTYAPVPGDIDLKVVATGQGRSLILGRTNGKVPWQELDAADDWKLDARFLLDRFPLGILAPLVDNRIGGTVSGQLELAQGEESSMLAHLVVDRLTSGRATLGSGVLTMKGSPGELLATITLKEDHRLLAVRASAAADTKQVPMPAQLENVQVELQTRSLDAAALGPMLESAVARLAGDVDANLTLALKHEASVVPGTPHRWRSSLTGTASLTRGGAYIESLGLELTDMSVEVKAQQRGERTELEFSNLKANARSDTTNLEGQGRLEMEDERVMSGTAGLRLRSVPITLQGLNLGKARGQALAKFSRQSGWDGKDEWRGRDYMTVDIELLDWEMRARPSASRDLIDLSTPSDIVVIQRRVEKEADPDLLPYRVDIDLGPRSTFKLADLEVPLQGNLTIDYTDVSVMRGTLAFRRGGRIPIFGQVFSVVDGSLRLDPKQPSNPGLDITLTGRNAYDQPVDVHITGTLKEPRTDPAPEELQALLGGGAGAALSGGVQALGVNQLIGESVQLRVDSATESEQSEATYTAAVQIDEDLWFEANYQRSQDNTLNQEQSEILSGTLDYRFHRNWSLRTRVGNTGGSVDLLWQYRY
jgi:hypothetical protein